MGNIPCESSMAYACWCQRHWNHLATVTLAGLDMHEKFLLLFLHSKYPHSRIFLFHFLQIFISTFPHGMCWHWAVVGKLKPLTPNETFCRHLRLKTEKRKTEMFYKILGRESWTWLGHLSKLKQGTRAMAIRRNHGRLVDCSTDHNHIWRFIWNWSRSSLEIHLMLVVVFILKQEKITAIRRTNMDFAWHSQPSVTEEKSWRGCDVLTHWQDNLPLVCGEAVLWYTWHPQICGLRCISLWCALVHYNSLTMRGDTFTCDIPRTFWRKMENEPKKSGFHHQQPQKILQNANFANLCATS